VPIAAADLAGGSVSGRKRQPRNDGSRGVETGTGLAEWSVVVIRRSSPMNVFIDRQKAVALLATLVLPRGRSSPGVH
jgi:hypothetical protein